MANMKQKMSLVYDFLFYLVFLFPKFQATSRIITSFRTTIISQTLVTLSETSLKQWKKSIVVVEIEVEAEAGAEVIWLVCMCDV